MSQQLKFIPATWLQDLLAPFLYRSTWRDFSDHWQLEEQW